MGYTHGVIPALIGIWVVILGALLWGAMNPNLSVSRRRESAQALWLFTGVLVLGGVVVTVARLLA